METLTVEEDRIIVVNMREAKASVGTLNVMEVLPSVSYIKEEK